MPFSLLQPLREIPLAIVDVETTGVSADLGDRVIEIGIARIECGRIAVQYEQLIDPQRHISAGVSALTGITQQMVAGQPTFKQALESICPLLKNAVVVGHNVRFDLWFLHREFRRCVLDICKELNDAHVMDTVRIARRRFGRGGNGLQMLCRRLGYEPPAAHRALADAITTFHVFEKMIEPIGGWGMNLCDAILLQGGPMRLLPDTSRASILPLELEEALDQKCCVMLEYLDASQNRTQRIIEPIEVRRFNGELVLIAHCQLRNDRRNFKVERIVRLIRMQDVQSVVGENRVDAAANSRG
jgi:DNA polymerase III epsilon subunit family exonuclease